jgi:hypothetical protein
MKIKNPTRISIRQLLSAAGLALLLLLACRSAIASADNAFTLAVIPDTQNYIDFRHQKAKGFEFDAADLFIQQMRYVAGRSVNNGGDIAFLAAVGDVWQHQTRTIDKDHLTRGIGIEPNPILGRRSKRADEVLNIELPRATEGYRIISEAGLPFGVAPGNHDYDATWSVIGYPPNRQKKWSELSRTVEDLGIMHIGGLDNFRSVFGADSERAALRRRRLRIPAHYARDATRRRGAAMGGVDYCRKSGLADDRNDPRLPEHIRQTSTQSIDRSGTYRA